jgi:hypothetical protein
MLCSDELNKTAKELSPNLKKFHLKQQKLYFTELKPH